MVNIFAHQAGAAWFPVIECLNENGQPWRRDVMWGLSRRTAKGAVKAGLAHQAKCGPAIQRQAVYDDGLRSRVLVSAGWRP